jgi:hypothetical protein
MLEIRGLLDVLDLHGDLEVQFLRDLIEMLLDQLQGGHPHSLFGSEGAAFQESKVEMEKS